MSSTAVPAPSPAASPAAPAPPASAPSDGKTGKDGGFFGRESSLPGVADATADMPGADPAKAGYHPPNELDAETAVERREKKAAAARDAAKKAKLPPAPKEGEPEKAEESEAEPDAEGAYEFAGQRWRDAAHAEHSFRTLRGQFKAKDKLATEASKLANDWHRAYQEHVGQLQARVAELERGQAAAAPESKMPAEKKAEKKSLVDAVDWSLFNELQKTKGAAFASGYLADVMDEQINARVEAAITRIQALVSEKTDPLAKAANSRAHIQKAQNFFLRMATMTDDAGKAIYPEYAQQDGENPDDPKVLRRFETLTQEIGHFWSKLPAEIQFTPRGFHLAYIEYRDWKARQAPKKSETPGGGEGEPSTADQLLEGMTAAEKARATLHGNGTPSMRRPQSPEEKGRAFAQSITNSGTRNSRLGFTE